MSTFMKQKALMCFPMKDMVNFHELFRKKLTLALVALLPKTPEIKNTHFSFLVITKP